jgi:hypothetical protein
MGFTLSMRLKDRIRVAIFPELASFGRKLGFSWDRLRKIFKHETLIAEVRGLAHQEAKVEQAQKKLHIVLLTYFPFQAPTHFLVGKALQQRGHKITIVMLDQVLPICELTDISNDYRRHEVAQYNSCFGLRFAHATGFRLFKLSELVPASKQQELKSSKDQRWKVYVDAMLLRYFKTGNLDPESHDVKVKYEAAQHAAAISAELGKEICRLSPDRVLITHGSYTSRGPAKDVVIDSGIPLISVQRGKLKDTMVFNWNVASDDWSVDSLWPEFQTKPFTLEMQQLIEGYLDSRRTHEHDQFVFNKTGEVSGEEALGMLGLDSRRPIYTLFSNVLWDAASAQKEIAFRSAKDWIIETTRYFVANPEKQLVIRTHPAESIIGTNSSVKQLVEDTFPNLPKNIKLLGPDFPLNSWTLLKVTDVGLVHTSTVGLELALEGKRCICVAKTHYRGKGFTEDVATAKEYFKTIESSHARCPRDDLRKVALQYAYLFFLKYHLPFPFETPSVGTGAKYFKTDNLAQILLSPYMLQIVSAIESRNQFASSDESLAQFHSGEHGTSAHSV